MTSAEYIEKLKALRDAAVAKGVAAVIVPNANELLANTKNRIMVEGKNSAGGNIGSYSTKKMYAGKEQFVKTGSFKAGPRPGAKTMRLDGGYKQLRAIQGRPVDKMNYNYSGDTMLAYQMQALKDVVLLGLTNERASKIRQGLEAKRGKAFYPTKAEITEYEKNVAADVITLQLKILKGA